MNLHASFPVFQVIFDTDGFAGELSFFTFRHKRLVKMFCNGDSEEKSASLKPDNHVKIDVFKHLVERIECEP